MQAKQKIPAVLILSSADTKENTVINDNFVAQLNKKLETKCHLEWHNYNDVGLEISDGILRAFIALDERDIHESFAAVYFKSYFRHHEQATAIAEALREHHTPYVGRELEHYIPAFKLSQLARLARGGVRVPHTIYLPIAHYQNQYDKLVEKLGKPFIFKAIDGSTGEFNYLIKSEEQLKKVIADSHGFHYIAQAFIPNESDLRVLIVGDEIKLVIERRRADDSTHLNNTSQGAQATLLSVNDLSESLQNLSLQAAKMMNRDVAGVDVMLEKDTGIPFILEVNASPQIASGAFAAEKVDIYADFFAKLGDQNG
jgi:glutathione synthase/RimK-type ligase-like ATP-grasp enzyme